MRFFSTVSVALTAALAAFSVASPVAEAESKVVARQSNPSIAALWTTAFSQITPHAQSLASLDPSTATEDSVKPTLENIQTPLNTLLTGVTALQSSGASANELLMSADGSTQLTPAELAQLMAPDMITLFNGLGAVHGCGCGTLGGLGGLLTAIGLLVYSILKIVLGLVLGLLICLTPLLVGLGSLLADLGLGLLSILLCL